MYWGPALPDFSSWPVLLHDFDQYTRSFEAVAGQTPLLSLQFAGTMTVSYVVLVYVCQHLMRNREPWTLYWPRVVHNIVLCLFSVVFSVSILYHLVQLVAAHGIEPLYCDAGHKQKNASPLPFWYYVFYLSKFYEFLDTAVLILRKKNVIFLHVYHHFITVWICYLPIVDGHPMQYMVIGSNGLIHCLMYYYYLCATVGWTCHWKKYLTTLQIIQFILDVSVNSRWLWAVAVENRPCAGSTFVFWWGQIILVTFLALFLHFYRKEFLARRKLAQEKKRK